MIITIKKTHSVGMTCFVDPVKEKEANRIAAKMGFREFKEDVIGRIAKSFSISLEMLLDDRFLYSQYRHMWE